MGVEGLPLPLLLPLMLLPLMLLQGLQARAAR
jgi:hypothetical protein